MPVSPLDPFTATGVELVPLDPATASDAELAAYHRQYALAHEHDLPGEPVQSYDDLVAELRKPQPGGRILRWLAVEDGEVVGRLRLTLDDRDNTDQGALDPTVRPDLRRAGRGRRLVGHALDVLRAEGRTLARLGTFDGTDGAAAADALGIPVSLAEAVQVLRLDRLDRPFVEAEAAADRPGYRPAGWRDAAPEELVEAYARAKTAMADAPHDDRWTPPEWTAARVRELEDQVRGQGVEFWVGTALDGNGEVAGLTEVRVVPTDPVRAAQWDTVVLPAHRGHGLGMWLKAAMLVRLLTERPEVREIETWNAVDNTHMRRINDRLGYEQIGLYQERPVAVDELAKKLGL